MKIFVAENYAIQALSRLKARPGVEVVEQCAEAEVALIRSRTLIDRHFLEGAPTLKLVVTATSGFDHIDWRECQRRGVTAAHCPEANAQAAAELTLALILAFERDLVGARHNVRGNQWREGLRRPRGLAGQDLGIIGLGRIGRRVAKLAAAFGMQVSAHDPYIEAEVFTQLGVERLGLIETLKANDYVSLHVPLTHATKHLLNQPTFHEMQNDAVLINTCRGPVVDENDLLAALDDGTIRGAAMDVIEREPPPKGHRVLTHPKLLLTPHIGAYTDAAWEAASNEAVDKVLKYGAGQPILDTLPLSAAWFEKT